MLRYMGMEVGQYRETLEYGSVGVSDVHAVVADLEYTTLL